MADPRSFRSVSMVKVPANLEPPFPPPSPERLAAAFLKLRDRLEVTELVIDEADVVERRVGEEVERLKQVLARGGADPAVKERLTYLQGYILDHLAKRNRAELVAQGLRRELAARQRDWRTFFERRRSV